MPTRGKDLILKEVVKQADGPESEGETIDELKGALRSERRQHRSAERQWAAEKSDLLAKIERLSHRLDLKTAALEQTEAHLSLMIQRLPWGVLVEGADHRIALTNDRFCSLFRMTIAPQRLVGTDLWAFDRNASGLFRDAEGYLDRLREIRSGTEPVLGDILELASGDVWQRDCIPMDAIEGGRGWIHLLRDVTEERAREAELKRAKNDAQEVNRSTAAFLAAMSHEMRTPLSAVLGLTETLKGEVTSDKQKQALCRIALNSEALLRLIEDVLDFVQLDEGRIRLSEGPLDPRDVVHAAVEQMAEAVQAKGLSLEVSVERSLPKRVLGDEARIRQLLVGLLGNALKFTLQGTIRVRAYRPPGGTLDEVCYEVRDTGIGIPREDLDRVFERFYRVNADSPGTGLGLSICRDLINLMGGQIGIESAEGRGTCVFFTLKQPALAEDERSDLDEQAPRSLRSVNPPAGAKPTILLVEDAADVRAMIGRFLESAGYHVRSLDNAQDALQILKKETFDALVTDISMPGMDGIDLVAALRNWETSLGRPATPTVVVTAYDLDEHKTRCREAGVDVFLTKPIKSVTLLRALAKLTRDVAKMLVVDDSADSRALLQVCLERYSSPLEVIAANSGRSAVMACQRIQFSMVFLDVLMSDMGGVETMKQIRSLPGYDKTPIVAVTGLTGMDDELKSQGFRFVVSKPIDMKTIHQVVREHLRSAAVVTRLSLERMAIESSPTLMHLVVPGNRIAEASAPQELVIAVDSDIRDLVPQFLYHRRRDTEAIREAVRAQDWNELRRIGHEMKGIGSSYGFPSVTEMGKRLEQVVREGDWDGALAIAAELEEFLDQVGLQGVPGLNRLPGQ